MASFAPEETAAPRKKKAPVEKPSVVTVAFQNYERVSYFLATKGDFNFGVDDQARAAFFDSFSTPDQNAVASLINELALKRIGSRKLPKGAHIEGLAIRTIEREKKLGKVRAEKQAAPKALKAEPLAATASMKKLLKKKGKKSVDEAGDLA